MSYNGYTNYETWDVCLWIDNEQGSYEYWRERAADIAESVRDAGEYRDEPDAKADAITQLADEMREYHEENKPEVHGVYSDILQAALERVDWREVAETRFDDDETFVNSGPRARKSRD